MGEPLFVIAQILGGVAVVLGFASYIHKSKQAILVLQLTIALVFTAHYILLGAYSAVPLNFLSVFSCLCYYFMDKKGKHLIWVPLAFAVLNVVLGALAWEGWHSLMVIAGVAVSTIGLALPKPQHARYAVLVKSPLCLAYNALVFSIGGVIYECAILTSAILGILRNRKEATE